ncbi:MAG: CRISPR-associated helicase Cas3', partial [Bacteroidota bacterium]
SIATCYSRETGNDLEAYLAVSRKGAEGALKLAGFDQPSALAYPGFESLFEFSPNPMQQALIDLTLPENGMPSLVIVEGPTGEGKTEGAFARAALQQAHTRGRGLYIAMPTQATSNGLFPRSLRFLEGAHRGGLGSFRLVHGNADLHPEQEGLLTDLSDLEALFSEDGTNAEGAVRTLRWFLPRKRSLLASYGLGTVDQAFLSVLYARHFFLRLFALSGKTVIFDEIHAYDLYMRHLFTRLLQWLHALGTHVILLSATLPQRLRDACFKAWGGAVYKGTPTAADIPYPAIWLAQDGRVDLAAHSFTTRWTQQARLRRHDPAPEYVAEALVKAYREGATVGLICNTVRRAQEIFDLLPEDVRGDVGNVMLLHARFRFGVRQAREQAVLNRFGKKRPNGQGCILVATQLAEQSLDLDFDVLFTDLAPIDLLLQRAGRLHRHLEARPSATRPEGYRQPTVFWLCPEADSGGVPDLSDIGIRPTKYTVYSPLIAWKTWRVLQCRDTWSLPTDYRILIESVYDGQKEAPSDVSKESASGWRRAVQAFEKTEAEARAQAVNQLIPEPTSGGLRRLLDEDRFGLAEENDDEAPRTTRALTRLGTDSIEVVAFFADEADALFMDPTCTQPAPLAIPEGRKDMPLPAIRTLLQNTVRLSYEDIAAALRSREDDDLPNAWQIAAEQTPALRYRHPLVLKDRRVHVAGYQIVDDEVLGIQMHR